MTRLSSLMILGLVGSCGTDDVVEVGFIEVGSQPFMFEAPDRVTIGARFEITVMTYGDTCVSPARTEVVQDDEVASVTPFDRTMIDSVCNTILLTFPHTAELVFATAGTKTIHTYGLRWMVNEDPIEVHHERTIIVE